PAASVSVANAAVLSYEPDRFSRTEEQRAWPFLDLPGSCRAEPAASAPKAGPGRPVSHPPGLVYGRGSGPGCRPAAQARLGRVLNGPGAKAGPGEQTGR